MGMRLEDRGSSKGPVWPAILIMVLILILLAVTHKGPTGDIPERNPRAVIELQARP